MRMLPISSGRTSWPARLLPTAAILALIVTAAPLSSVRAEDAPASTKLVDAAELARSVKIYRDNWGVPHIDGPTDESVVFGFAYCQAEDYFWQVEDSYILGLGRYSEVHGTAGIEQDTLNRAFEIPQRSQADFAKLDPKMQRICAAFTEGINFYLQKHPEVEPRLLTHFEPWYVLAFGRQVVLEMGWGKVGIPKNAVPTEYEEIVASQGSNAWAIAPERTASGNTMLFINPHQPYFGYGQFYEGHLRSGEGWNFTGATFFGSPLPTLGHNEHLGWAYTVNNPRLGSSWRVTFDDPDNPLNYRHGDGYRTAEEWTDTIKVKKGRGYLDRELTFRKTHHGPIVRQESDDVYIAANIGKFNDAFASRQNLEMLRATNLDEFRQAMSKLEFHIFNTVYADRQGNIFYLYNGIVPRRDPKFDWTKTVDGSNPETDWQGIHDFEDLPQTLNPVSGFVQNCNQSPFTVTDDGSPFKLDYPNYMVIEKEEDNRRAMVSRMLLREMRETTFDRWKEAAYDTTMYWALTEIPRYGRHYQKLRETNPELAEAVQPYMEHLLDWDFICTHESTQATLCCAWYEKLYGEPYRSETLVRKYQEEPEQRFQALIDAAGELKRVHGDWKIPYGDINRLQRHADVADFFKIPFSDDKPSLPSAGLPGPIGVVFNMYFTPSLNIPLVKTIKKHYAVVGHSYVSVVEFGDKVHGVSALQFGQSGDPASPHFFDQAELLSQKKFKDQPFYWDEVEAAAVRVYHPGEEQTVAAN